MSIGVLFSITSDDSAQLAAQRGNDEAIRVYVEDVIEERDDQEHLADLDKAWDALHRCLTDGALAPGGGYGPVSKAVLGGRSLTGGDDYIVLSQCASTPPSPSGDEPSAYSTRGAS